MSAPYHPEPPGGLSWTDEVAILLRSMTYAEFMALADGIGVSPCQLHAWATERGLPRSIANGVDVWDGDLPAVARRTTSGV